MLGPYGVNLRDIQQRYNDATANRRGDLIPLEVTIYDDRSHTLRFRTPPTSFLLRRALNGSPVVSRAVLREVALAKLPDLNTDDIEAAMRTVAGTARSMGLPVENG